MLYGNNSYINWSFTQYLQTKFKGKPKQDMVKI